MIVSSDREYYYRCEVHYSPDAPTSTWIRYSAYPVVKHTKQSVILDMPYTKNKRVLETWWNGDPTTKRWAWSTKGEALISACRRKELQIALLEGQLMRARRELRVLKEEAKK